MLDAWALWQKRKVTDANILRRRLWTSQQDHTVCANRCKAGQEHDCKVSIPPPIWKKMAEAQGLSEGFASKERSHERDERVRRACFHKRIRKAYRQERPALTCWSSERQGLELIASSAIRHIPIETSSHPDIQRRDLVRDCVYEWQGVRDLERSLKGLGVPANSGLKETFQQTPCSCGRHTTSWARHPAISWHPYARMVAGVRRHLSIILWSPQSQMSAARNAQQEKIFREQLGAWQKLNNERMTAWHTQSDIAIETDITRRTRL